MEAATVCTSSIVTTPLKGTPMRITVQQQDKQDKDMKISTRL